MNDQDRDLVAALADGRLSTTAAEDALARIEAEPEMSVEYAHQIAALEFLNSGVAPRMTVREREALHTSLTEKLGLAPETTPPPSPRKQKIPWWQPVFGLATAAAVVAAIVILPGTLTGGSQDTASFDLAGAVLDDAEVEQSETTITEVEAMEARPEDGQVFTDKTQVAAPDSERDVLEDLLKQDQVYESNSATLEDLLSRARGADSPAAVSRLLSPPDSNSTVDLNTDDVAACIDELEADLPEGITRILVLGAGLENDVMIIHLGFDFGSGVEDGLSFVLDTCTLVDHGPQG
jgi:anti-sigma factor RsiW